MEHQTAQHHHPNTEQGQDNEAYVVDEIDDVYIHHHRFSTVEELDEDDGGFLKIQNGSTVTNGTSSVVYNNRPSSRKFSFEDAMAKKYDEVDENLNDKKPNDKKKKKKKRDEKSVGVFELFAFADKLDVVLMIFGTLGSLVTGCAFPINLLFYGEVANAFLEPQLRPLGPVKDNISKLIELCKNPGNITCPTRQAYLEYDTLFQTVSGYSRAFIGIACGVLIMGYISMAFWTLTAERQIRRIRRHFFHAILKQEISWHDQHQAGELTARMADDISQIHEGMGEKVATFVQWITTFVAGYIMSFVQGWKLALVILATAPLMIIGGAVMSQLLKMQTVKELKAYAKAGAIAEEVLIAIRTVAAFGGEQKEIDRYRNNLDSACKMGIRKGLLSGAGLGYIWFVVYAAFGLAFYYGSVLVRDGEYKAGTVLQVFFGILIGSISLGHAAPNLESFATARGAAGTIFEVIKRIPRIDSSSEKGERPPVMEGNLEFENVYFSYPTREDVSVLNGLNLNVGVGETVALVGPSGCGKSTTVQLIQRFYDATKGKIKINGRDVRDLNVNWLRKNIGIVSQEPVLFAMSISENIRFGKPSASLDEIEKAAKEANAHDFIMELPDKYDTLVGERGAQLSGGQKQRIAIARALVKNPQILLLDEATSALDTESEATVQAALDQASHGRTTIIIAHRLSTVRNADKIVGIKDGVVEEMGSHHDLMEKKGLYHDLVMGQIHADQSTAADFFAKFQSRSRTVSDPLRRRAPSSSSSPALSRHRMHLDADSDDGEEGSTFGMFMRNMSYRESIRSLRSVTEMNIEPGFGDINQISSDEGYDEEDGESENLEKEQLDPQIGRLMKLNSKEWPWITLGCISAIFTGAVHPVFAVVMGEILKIFQNKNKDQQAEDSLFMSMMLLVIGGGACIFNFTQSLSFAVSGERLTLRLRDMSFRAMMKQDIGYYDDPKNLVGACTSRLASDASAVRGATGAHLGNMIHAFSSIATALTIAFSFGWQLTLVILAFMPVTVVAASLQSKVWTGYTKGEKRAVENGGKLASESVDNIRTVASLTQESYFEDEYNIKFTENYKNGRIKIHLYGLMYSFSQCIVFFAYSAAFSYGAYLVQLEAIKFYNVFRIFGAITFGGQAVGRISSFAPDYAKAKIAAAKIFQLLDRKPPIDSSDTSGVKPDSCKGEITFSKIKFSYPTRPDVQVLQGIDVTIHEGETVALVGSSGCGKSTSVQLIERFYDPCEGSLLLDGNDARALNIQWLRQQIGIVSQEPILFDASISENIAYGDNSREVRMDDIIEAARKANIHAFIDNLPQGYDTRVGGKGAQLSGGQKQRIAIARALVRHPKILLLDEATSALDTESEMVVQEALDRARVGRTCLIIAHRLSTVQTADRILVIKNGNVVEQGTHGELLAAKGFYYKLNTMQVQQKRKDRVGAFS